jgi:hypothetical protein
MYCAALNQLRRSELPDSKPRSFCCAPAKDDTAEKAPVNDPLHALSARRAGLGL